ncbi:S-adenosyl-L-methionine-dependent methyltransferase [Podospora australis]|uniref:S-adenosyl-L-methionine-dependent methyltransferase n=1 Tax=Podospora australis TaxID=1536484 RepID=A0AAN6X0B6_9PEZI|nr:S-adenosyl-L-methionine-dependent methyltransferase [Podospora australis]
MVDKSPSPAPGASKTASPASPPPIPETTQTQQDAANIQVDDFDDSDGDSALGTDAESSTASISSSILNYRRENGRTYHSFRDGKYYFPNDDKENDRLDFQHHQWFLTLNGRLGLAPPTDPDSKGGRVLDVGTGTGIWAIDYGDEHPDAHIIGIDLSPIQPSFTPPNVHFQIDDIEDEWTFTQPFDYIHIRAMSGAISNWPALISKCYENLKPGGWIEIQEPGMPVSDDGTYTKDSAFAQASQLLYDGLAQAGNKLVDVFALKGWLEEAGFPSVQEKKEYWPSNPWPKDKRLKEIGMWHYTNMSSGIEGFLMAIATRGLGWSSEGVTVLCAQAKADLADRRIHAYWPVVIAYAQKPE